MPSEEGGLTFLEWNWPLTIASCGTALPKQVSTNGFI